MTYNAAIPNANDLISNSQSQLKDNFTQLNTQFAVDHNAFNTGSGNGNGHHKQVFFDNAPTAPTVSGTQSAVYPHLVSAAQELFFKNAVGAVQLTGPSSAATSGYATLPGGFVIQWGFAANQASGATISFPSSTAFTTACYNVQLTAGRASTTVHSLYVGTGTITQTGFGIKCDVNQDVYFFAIGK